MSISYHVLCYAITTASIIHNMLHKHIICIHIKTRAWYDTRGIHRYNTNSTSWTRPYTYHNSTDKGISCMGITIHRWTYITYILHAILDSQHSHATWTVGVCIGSASGLHRGTDHRNHVNHPLCGAGWGGAWRPPISVDSG